MKYFVSILYVLKEGIKENIAVIGIFVGVLMIVIGLSIMCSTPVSAIGNSNDYLIK